MSLQWKAASECTTVQTRVLLPVSRRGTRHRGQSWVTLLREKESNIAGLVVALTVKTMQPLRNTEALCQRKTNQAPLFFFSYCSPQTSSPLLQTQSRPAIAGGAVWQKEVDELDYGQTFTTLDYLKCTLGNEKPEKSYFRVYLSDELDILRPHALMSVLQMKSDVNGPLINWVRCKHSFSSCVHYNKPTHTHKLYIILTFQQIN